MDGNIVYIQLMQYTAGASFMFLLWLCMYFLRNGSGNRLRQITGWVLLVWVIQSVKDMALIWYPTVRFEFLHHVFVLIDMTAVPTCAFLLLELTRPGSMTLRRAVLHEIPFLLFILVYVLHPMETLYESAITCAVAYGTVVMLYVLFEIPAYHKRLKQKLFLPRTHRPAVVVYHTSLFRGVPGGMEPVFHLLFRTQRHVILPAHLCHLVTHQLLHQPAGASARFIDDPFAPGR